MKVCFSKLWSNLKKFFYLDLKRCMICFKVVEEKDINTKVCKDCWERLNTMPHTYTYCPKCGLPYVTGMKDTICSMCRNRSFPWNKISYFGFYKDLLKEIIVSYKFDKKFHLCSVLGELLIKAYKRGFSDFIPDVIVPVPVFKNSLKSKGFNHALEISKPLSKYLNRKIDFNALLKIKPTKPQVGLDQKERWKNLKGAFWADPDRVKGQSVLLIDDVFTTGATSFMCSAELKRAGAKTINVLVVARSID